MATRSIVTHHPEVACDVCGRRLLRGERPEAFIDAGQRLVVCELCTPRAVGSGWMRESEALAATPGGERGRSGRSLMGRLRQRRHAQAEVDDELDDDEESGGGRRAAGRRWARRSAPRELRNGFGAEARDAHDEHDEHDFDEAYGGGPEQFDPLLGAQTNGTGRRGDDVPPGASRSTRRRGAGAEADDRPYGDVDDEDGEELYGGDEHDAHHRDEHDGDGESVWGEEGHRARGGEAGQGSAATSVATMIELALERFNESDAAGRIAGIARSLGEPEVSVRALDEHGQRVSVVVAWELCWYRYEIDLDADTPSVALSGDGMELHELSAEDRAANARADERGALALL